VLARIAYFFERADGGQNAQDYLKLVEREVLRWMVAFREDDCRLTWGAEGSEILIRDRRPSFPPRDWRLRDHAVHVFRALDDPRPAEIVVREADRLAQGGAPEAAASPTLVMLRPRHLSAVPPPDETPPWRIAQTGLRGYARWREEVISFSRAQFAADAMA